LFHIAGRIQIMLLLRLIGFSCMAIMGIFTSFWTNSPLIIFIFLLRTGVNNAGYPIQKAVLMDYVPKVGLSTNALLIVILNRPVSAPIHELAVQNM